MSNQQHKRDPIVGSFSPKLKGFFLHELASTLSRLQQTASATLVPTARPSRHSGSSSGSWLSAVPSSGGSWSSIVSRCIFVSCCIKKHKLENTLRATWSSEVLLVHSPHTLQPGEQGSWCRVGNTRCRVGNIKCRVTHGVVWVNYYNRFVRYCFTFPLLQLHAATWYR